MPDVSFIYLTYRPGSIDLLARSFMQQDHSLYELIVVDDYPGRVERGRAKKFLEDHKIPLTYYGTGKPKDNPDTLCGLANAMNTGLIYVNSPFVVFLHDYSLLVNQAAKAWKYVYNEAVKDKGKAIITGGAIVYNCSPPDKVDDITAWENPPKFSPNFPWVPYDFECFYFGGPIEFFEEINGVDERADHSIAWSVSSLHYQARQYGYRFFVEPTFLVCHLMDHRKWEPDEDVVHSQWRISGNWSTEKEEPEWQPRSPNKFDLRELRSKRIHGKATGVEVSFGTSMVPQRADGGAGSQRDHRQVVE